MLWNGNRSGLSGLHLRTEAVQQAVKAEESAVQIDTLRRAAGSAKVAQGLVFAVSLTEFVDAFHKHRIRKIEDVGTERAGKKINGLPDQRGNPDNISRRVGGEDKFQRAQGCQECGLMIDDNGIEQCKLAVVELPRNGAGAPEVQHPQFTFPDKEISRMWVGMKKEQGVDLIVVKVPQRLANLIPLPLTRRAVGESIERLAIYPVQGEDAGRASVRIERGEPDMIQSGTGGREFLRTAQFHLVVRLLKQAGFDFLEVMGNIGFPQTQHLKGNGFDDPEVAGQAVSDAGILHFYRDVPTMQDGAMDLADAGSMSGVRGEGVKEGFDRLAKLPLDRAADERPGKGRRGILGLGELRRVGCRQKLLIHAEHLRQFERAALQLTEGLVDAAGVGSIQGIAGGSGARRSAGSDGALAIVFQIVHPHGSSGPGKSGHAGKRAAADAVLTGEGFGGGIHQELSGVVKKHRNLEPPPPVLAAGPPGKQKTQKVEAGVQHLPADKIEKDRSGFFDKGIRALIAATRIAQCVVNNTAE